LTPRYARSRLREEIGDGLLEFIVDRGHHSVWEEDAAMRL
jgi:hypothetical protein